MDPSVIVSDSTEILLFGDFWEFFGVFGILFFGGVGLLLVLELDMFLQGMGLPVVFKIDVG
jgi:hypothetical protein